MNTPSLHSPTSFPKILRLKDEVSIGIAQPSEAIAEQATQRWLISPLFDLLFISGAAPWILGFISYLALGSDISTIAASPSQQALTLLFVVSSLLIGESHQFTSILRYYSIRRTQKNKYTWQRLPFWFLYLLAALVVIAIAASGLGLSKIIDPFMNAIGVVIGPIFTNAMLLFPVILMQHVCAQAKAIGLIYCGKQRFKLSPIEKASLSVSTWALVATGACTIAAPFNGMTFSPGTLPASFDFASLAGICVPSAVISVALTAILFLGRGLKTSQWLPAGAAYLWINMIMLILLPVPQLIYVWLFVPIFLHASQHWAIAYLTQQDDFSKQGRQPQNNMKELVSDLCRLILPVQAVTLCVLYIPLLLSLMEGHPNTDISATLSVGWSMLVFYIHYFADRIVWRPQ